MSRNKQTRAEQVAKEIVVYTQNNVGNTQNCFDFAIEEINKYFVEKDKLRKQSEVDKSV